MNRIRQYLTALNGDEPDAELARHASVMDATIAAFALGVILGLFAGANA